MPTETPSPTWLATLAAALAAAAAGLFAGWVDFHQDEPQPAVLILLVGCGFVGLFRPEGAWRWALLAGLGIPAVLLIGRAMGATPFGPPSSSNWGYLLPLIPAFIGAYGGALARRALAALF